MVLINASRATYDSFVWIQLQSICQMEVSTPYLPIRLISGMFNMPS